MLGARSGFVLDEQLSALAYDTWCYAPTGLVVTAKGWRMAPAAWWLFADRGPPPVLRRSLEDMRLDVPLRLALDLLPPAELDRWLADMWDNHRG